MNALDTLLNDASKMAPDEGFMAQMMQEALAHQPVPSIARVPWWQQVPAILGGWQGMGGLVAATCVGFWVGINPPDTMPTSFETLLNMDAVYGESEDTAELFGFGWEMEEG
jgi:hypothetical protein